MLAVMKKLTYDEEYNFENEVRIFIKEKSVLILFTYIKLTFQVLIILEFFKTNIFKICHIDFDFR